MVPLLTVALKVVSIHSLSLLVASLYCNLNPVIIPFCSRKGIEFQNTIILRDVTLLPVKLVGEAEGTREKDLTSLDFINGSIAQKESLVTKECLFGRSVPKASDNHQIAKVINNQF